MAYLVDRRSLLIGTLGLLAVLRVRPALAQDGTPFPSPLPLPSIQPRPGAPLRVVTSTSILADLARQIGGERVVVQSILPANADPHDFEASPDDVISIEDADIVFLHGLQLDTWAEPLIEAAQTSAPTVVATKGIQTLGSSDQDFSEGDPHVWFDPNRTAQMVANIRDGLVSVDPDGAAGYDRRLQEYDRTLQLLDAEIARRVNLVPQDRRVLVTNHDALAYYAGRYGLTIVGTVIPGLDSRTEPSAKELAELIDRIQQTGVHVIFVENTVSPALADSLASDAGIRVAPELYTDSLGDPGSGADTYVGLMEIDTTIIVENLRA